MGLFQTEYLFRGKRKDTGEWVDGNLLILDGDRQAIAVAYDEDEDNFASPAVHPIELIACEVVTETVGQFTGRLDANEQKIFDGDIILVNGRLFVVVWSAADAAFVCTDKISTATGKDAIRKMLVETNRTDIDEDLDRLDENSTLNVLGDLYTNIFTDFSDEDIVVIGNIHDEKTVDVLKRLSGSGGDEAE